MKTPPKPKQVLPPAAPVPMGVPNPSKLPPAVPVALDKYLLAMKKPTLK